MFDAFKRYMDPKDRKISFYELFHDLEDVEIKTKQPLLYDILERILELEEISENDRIDFDLFIKFVFKALNQRKTTNQIKMIFNLFDDDNTGFIQASNL